MILERNAASLGQALNNAFKSYLQQFEQLDVNKEGSINIKSYGTQYQEVELRLNGADFTVTGVKND